MTEDGTATMRRFLDYVNSRLGISKSSYYYYMEHYAFMSKYPKFQTLAMSFRVFRNMIPKIKEWFVSQECQALDSSNFYSEKYWMNVDEETGEVDMNILNEHNSTAVENNNWQPHQPLTHTDSSDDENNSVAFHHRGQTLQQIAPQLMTPSDCSDDDTATDGGIDIATFFHRWRSTENVHRDGKKF